MRLRVFVSFFFLRVGAIAFDCAIANATVGAMQMQMRVNDIAILYDMNAVHVLPMIMQSLVLVLLLCYVAGGGGCSLLSKSWM